ncbi:MAG: tetratricopeptide repeat protein [Hyphomicrobium sp.]
MPTVKVVANPSKGDGMPESVQETVRTHLDHGRACLDKGKYDDAIADYDKAIALDPNDATAYTNRGVAFGRKGEYDRAAPLPRG